ncbi:lysine acetyltransferase [Colletotrichum simmondsii]|uniref:Lysine acetyltransferase n=1 Tax=Colletotrichum simmondsii TaxID=703756 RepID=A0A135RZL2_9PEZI|nr:lysine acetyltransferase [Colletotrichum simmondsii]
MASLASAWAKSKVAIASSSSPDLQLDHPTPEECIQIWTVTADEWKDSLTLPLYILESAYLTTVPLAKDGGMTTWVLVDKTLPPNERDVFCSCETFRKRCLVSDSMGNMTESIIHGVASVFCPEKFRGRGYAARHMKELATVLRGWQSENGKVIGSVLYSDIGKEYYAKLRWTPNPVNRHLVLPPARMEIPAASRPIFESDLESLCLRDKAMIQNDIATPSPSRKRVVILPDLDHILWHIRKEDYIIKQIFGKQAVIKGAIAGVPGKQVWAIWVRRYYSHPDYHSIEDADDKNVLYILRLVMEGDETANKPREGNMTIPMKDYAEQAAALKAVMQAAQAEAAGWRLDQVQLWDPSPLVKSLLDQSDLDSVFVERQSHSIASLLWFEDGEGLGPEDAPILINNEHYAWC